MVSADAADLPRGLSNETGKAIAVGRIRITDAGRRWLEDAAKSELRGPNRFKDFWRE
jgi:hypothetical protein